jgi:hypothetical protein
MSELMMTQIAFEKAAFHIIQMVNQKKNEEYNENLFKLVNIIIKNEIVNELHSLSFYEYFEMTYNCLYIMLSQAEKREEYELCAFIVEIIENENLIMKEWINSLPENDKEEMEEQFENLQLSMKIIKENY